jgi:hypothetical protein
MGVAAAHCHAARQAIISCCPRAMLTWQRHVGPSHYAADATCLGNLRVRV